MENYFVELNKINVNEHTEKKNGLTYLSWAWAWAELKSRHPDANFKIYENEQGWNYFTDGRTAWVKVGVSVNGIEHIEHLPVMDYRNKSIPLEQITSFNTNSSIRRALCKAIALHGIGLYIYAGEDIPQEERTPMVANVYGGNDNAEWDSLRQQIFELAEPKLCEAAAKKRYGKRFTELTVDEMRCILEKMKEKANGTVG